MIHPFTTVEKWHRKFQFDKETMDEDKFEFRGVLLNEEVDEYNQACYDKNPEEVVDALIDIIWIACGTLDLLGVDFDKAFSEVARANNDKTRGIKPGRESSGGFDVIKNPGWKAPDHSDNWGKLNEILK